MRRFLTFLLILVLAGGGGVLLLGAAVLQDEPALSRMPAPEPDDVRAARAFYTQIRAATNGAPDAPETVTLPVETLQSILRLGARFVPDYRAEAVLVDGVVQIRAALSVPWIGGARWLNLRADIAPFEERLVLDQVRLGERAIAPDLAMSAARLGANLWLGQGMGDKLLGIPRTMTIADNAMVFALHLDREGRAEMVQGVFGALRGADMPAPERVEAYYVQLRDAMDRGDLGPPDAFLPLVQHVLMLAHAQSDDMSAADEVTAAILALAKACSGVDFETIFGASAGRPSGALGSWQESCRGRKLADRIDLRRHFITAAAIKAASSRGFAVSMGEFKELHDSISGAGGFDFTDITANNSGIRLAGLFVTAPRADWPDLIARIQTEADILPALDGIPGIMPREQFLAQFGDLESPTYQAMLAQIEGRIDALALHVALRGPDG